MLKTLRQSALARPVDVYVMAHRAAKYGALIIALVMGCFMFELFRRLRPHPVQYGLVGLSIVLFFLLLVALSEKLRFGAVPRSARRGLGRGTFVAVLHAALFGLLASEGNGPLPKRNVDGYAWSDTRANATVAPLAALGGAAQG